MKKLKNKTFILISSILSAFLLFILLVFNISIYNNEYTEIKNNINRISNKQNILSPDRENLSNNPIFIDMDVYIISFDRFGKIRNISNYANDGLSNDEIINIVNSHNIKPRDIGNLYTSKYLFSFNHQNELIIINNTCVRNFLISNIIKSIVLFIIIELIILYASYMLTKWLIKPVEESFQKQKQFIYDASHELKTPLAIIMASAETYEDNPKEKKWLNNIKEESNRMNNLVLKLLDLSKTEDLKDNVIYSKVNLSKIINNKAMSFESLMFENKLSLVTEIEKNIEFECDQDKIKELLSILIDNAIKHGYEDSEIKVRLYLEKNNINLEVINRGDAIDSEDKIKIFERFYRVDKARNRSDGRYGLGLAIAKNIVEAHNGNITVECNDGYTTFKVIFKRN